MAQDFKRTDRIADQMQRDLAELLRSSMKDPRVGMVTVNQVVVAKDLGFADVYVTLLTVDDLDADPVTDYYHTFQWTDADSNWPGEGTLPLVLLSGTVTPNESLERFVINVEPVKPAEGYEIIAESLRLNVGTVSLDIDGNGKAEPLTDGLLVIRYLFGFSGESLIQGAVASDATRKEADEIAAAVEALVP